MPTTRDLDAELDERLQRYAASGMSRAGMLAQLNLAGYPTNKLRERFPEMSDVAFGITTPTSDPGQQGRAATPRHPSSLQNQNSQDAPTSAGASRSAEDRPPQLPFHLETRATSELTRATRDSGGGRRHLFPLRAADPVLVPARRSRRVAQLHAQERLARTDARHHAPRNRIAVRRARATAHHLRRERSGAHQVAGDLPRHLGTRFSASPRCANHARRSRLACASTRTSC